LISIERLLAADPHAGVEEVMDADPPMVAPDTDQERAARQMLERHECSVAVVDADGRFVGLIPPYRMLRVLLNEHDEDLARLGGYLAGSTRARGAAEESVTQRLWHRLPWLLIGLLGAMGATAIVGGFKDQLEANVLLAFFIPAVVYMADAVGTQTETVLIRALSAGITVRSVLRRELLTGLVMGAVIGAAFLVFALIGWGDVDVAVAVAVAMFASCSIATLVAMALPALFQRLGLDPAFGCGPLATVLQDLLSIAVYLAIVVAVVV
jgi:magnesium transporter